MLAVSVSIKRPHNLYQYVVLFTGSTEHTRQLVSWFTASIPHEFRTQEP